MELTLEPPLTRHRLTVDQYHRMAETGVLEPDARVELLNGEIVDMAPIGSLHSSGVNRLQLLLIEALARRAVVLGQSAMRLSDHSEPQPDIAVLKLRDDFYARSLPTPADALLVVEVADSTLKHDLTLKAALYAAAGIAEYWVIDVSGSRLHQHRKPQGEVYAEVVVTLKPGLVVVPGLAGVSVDLARCSRRTSAAPPPIRRRGRALPAARTGSTDPRRST